MRRVRVERVQSGSIELARAEAHHARDVLRRKVGDEIEVFDDAGRSAAGNIVKCDGGGVVVMIEQLNEQSAADFEWTVASAVPKGNRADWMIEKLSELGTGEFVPLITERSVVSAEGKNKRERWDRLAREAAKQSRRRGVMKIGEVMEVGKLVSELCEEEVRIQNSEFRRKRTEEEGGTESLQLRRRPSPQPSPGVPGEGVGGEREARGSAVWYLSAGEEARKMSQVVEEVVRERISRLTLLIGPEGGWSEREMGMFDEAGLTGVRMGATILRVETAAVAAAAIVAGLVEAEFSD
jgi:16S rRNA (uracil1498-N3)-methyltransferase